MSLLNTGVTPLEKSAEVGDLDDDIVKPATVVAVVPDLYLYLGNGVTGTQIDDGFLGVSLRRRRAH